MKIDSFEEHGELGARQCETCFAAEGQRETKSSFFETFIPDGESVVVPVKDFEFVTFFVEKDEERRRERIAVQTGPDDSEQPVEPLR